MATSWTDLTTFNSTANFGINALVQNTSATPGTPSLASISDTGISNSDRITNRDNSTSSKTLQFLVSGTVSGATVTIYSSGTAIGSTVASGASTTVTTNGSYDLVDGSHSITARQTESGKSESVDSSALSVTIDTVAPTAPVRQTLKPPATRASATPTTSPRSTRRRSTSQSLAASTGGFTVAARSFRNHRQRVRTAASTKVRALAAKRCSPRPMEPTATRRGPLMRPGTSRAIARPYR